MKKRSNMGVGGGGAKDPKKSQEPAKTVPPKKQK